MATNTADQETQARLAEFEDSITRLESAKADVRRNETRVHNAESRLAQWMLPAGNKDKVFHVWHGDHLITVESGLSHPTVTVTKNARKVSE